MLIGGIVAATVLFVLGPRYRERQVDQLARGLVGCVTPLIFTEPGTFYVFQEVVGPELAPSGCTANPQPGDFFIGITGPAGAVALVDDRTVAYNEDGAIGTSVRRFEVPEPGVYELTVTGPDAGIRAAVGDDPGAIADTYRQWALIAGLGGVIAGLALIVFASVGGKRDADAAVALEGEPYPPASFAPPAFGTPDQVPNDPPPTTSTGWAAPVHDDRRG